jgi:flagellar motility protein MotE (MotC chaperone)
MKLPAGVTGMAIGNKKIWKSILITLLCLKMATIAYFLLNMEISHLFMGGSTALAEQEKEDAVDGNEMQGQADPVDEFLESIKQRRLTQIQEREEALNKHSETVRTEESRLKKVEKDLQAMLTELDTIQQGVDQKIKDAKKTDEEQLSRLAKVYEETPPEQAGPMLMKLEPHMAADILIRMNPKKAGKIWGQVTPVEGVKISEELVKLK